MKSRFLFKGHTENVIKEFFIFYTQTNMSSDYLMNTATVLYLVCYAPEFYANYINKNANLYNVFEKVVMLTATSFGLGYAVSIENQTLIANYGPLVALDSIALLMRSYYAYKNRHIDVRILDHEETKNPIQENENDLDL
jgi:hypothetical protein